MLPGWVCGTLTLFGPCAAPHLLPFALRSAARAVVTARGAAGETPLLRGRSCRQALGGLVPGHSITPRAGFPRRGAGKGEAGGARSALPHGAVLRGMAGLGSPRARTAGQGQAGSAGSRQTRPLCRRGMGLPLRLPACR